MWSFQQYDLQFSDSGSPARVALTRVSLSVFLSELAFSLQLNTADVDWLIKSPVSFFLCSDWLIHSKPFLAVETCPFYVNTFNSQLNTIPQLVIAGNISMGICTSIRHMLKIS